MRRMLKYWSFSKLRYSRSVWHVGTQPLWHVNHVGTQVCWQINHAKMQARWHIDHVGMQAHKARDLADSTKSCPSKMKWRIPNCNKRHHSSIHISTQIATQTNQNMASNDLNSNNLEVNTCLQIIRISILNGWKYIKNILLETGSDVKLLKSDLAIKLRLNANYKILWNTNGISKTSELEQNQVSFNVLSNYYPNWKKTLVILETQTYPF